MFFNRMNRVTAGKAYSPYGGYIQGGFLTQVRFSMCFKNE